MTISISRRAFLSQTVAATTLSALSLPLAAQAIDQTPSAPHPVDLHVHLDNSTIDKVIELSKERGIKFGIVEHAGTKENIYPVVLSNDTELKRYLAMLKGKPVFKGIQTEWTDWMGCFSRETLAQLDYVLTDAMTFPGKDGRRVKLWERDAPQRVDMRDKDGFMDRYVQWYVDIMAKQPIDIMANATWLPAGLGEQWDHYWTPPRMQQVIDAAVQYGVAIEISSSLRLPKRTFLALAKAAGVKFSFGSNGRYPNMGKLDYSLQMAKELDLKPSDLYTPAPDGRKAVQRRTW